MEQKSPNRIAASNASQNAEKPWTEVTSGNRKRKNTSISPPKTEPEKRRAIFRKETSFPQKSEADLMLILNESLQSAGLPAHVRFCKVGYSHSGAVSGLLTERSNVDR